jgi:hypothetical protein
MINTERLRPVSEWAQAFWRDTTREQVMAPVDCDLSASSLIDAREAIGPGEYGAFLLTVHDYAKHYALQVCFVTFGRRFPDVIRVVHTPLIPEDAWALENGDKRYISNGA